MTTPKSGQLTVQVAGQVTAQVAAAVLSYCQEPRTAKEIQLLIGLRHRETFLANYLNPLLKKAWLKRTIPGRPTSRLQRYRTTGQGMKWVLARAASVS